MGTIFTILISFLVSSLSISHFWNSSDISLKNSSQIALYRYNNSVVNRAGVWGLQEFCKLGIFHPLSIDYFHPWANLFPATRIMSPVYWHGTIGRTVPNAESIYPK